MRAALSAGAILLLFLSVNAISPQQKATSLKEVQAAIDVNLKTPEGKAYDARFGNEFLQKRAGDIRACKKSAGNDFRSFWILAKMEKDGTAQMILLYPETKLGTCARSALLRAKYPPPPDYWVGVYLQLSH